MEYLHATFIYAVKRQLSHFLYEYYLYFSIHRNDTQNRNRLEQSVERVGQILRQSCSQTLLQGSSYICKFAPNIICETPFW